MMNDVAVAALRAIIAQEILTSSTASEHQPTVVPHDFAQGLVQAADRHRLLGPLIAVANSGAVLLPDDIAADLLRRHGECMQWCLTIECSLLRLNRWFVQTDVRYLVLKGPAIAHLDEEDPSMRAFADLDLLVRSEDIDRAVELLQDHGGTRLWPQRRPGFDRRFSKGVTVTMPGGVQIDVHRMWSDGVHGHRVPQVELFDAATAFKLGGEQIPALSRLHRMLHAAYHAVLGSTASPLLNLRDIARYLTCSHLTPELVTPTAVRWRGEAVLAEAVDLALGLVPVPAPKWSEWRARVQLSQREVDLVRRQRLEGSSFGPAKLNLWWELPGVSDKAAYAFAVLWPTREHLTARHLRRADVLRSLVQRRSSW